MTRKLYELDAMCFAFSAQVLSCQSTPRGYRCVLDQTAFFPEAGGQVCDRGFLGDAQVTDVQIENGIIFHLCSSPLSVGDKVEGKLDRARRLRLMEHHSGEHLLSGLIRQHFGFDNVGFHLSEQTVTLDTSGFLDDEQIVFLEREANRILRENRPITALFPSSEEAESLSYRSKSEISQGLRLVKIEGVDLCACCAPHLSTTGQIGALFITDHIRYKGGTRISLSCGGDALAFWREEHQELLQIARHLSVPSRKAYAAVKKAGEEQAEKTALIKNLQQERLRYILESCREKNIPFVFCEKLSPKERMELCEGLCRIHDGLCGVFSGKDGQGYGAAMGSKDGNMRPLFSRINALLNGRGGGNDKMYQGNLNTTREAIEAFVRNPQGESLTDKETIHKTSYPEELGQI